MECLILGSGTILQTDYRRNCSGYLIDRSMLLDCGPGVWRALGATGITAAVMHHILLTHFHIDHVADLLPFLMARFLSLKVPDTELQIYGPQGLRDWYRQLRPVAGSWLPDLQVNLTEVSDPFEVNGYAVIPAATGHTENSLCYRITGPDRKVLFYSGDSGYNAAIIDQAFRSDVCILEASNTDETRIAGHLTPALAGKIAQQAEVRHLILTHMYPEVLAIDARSQAASYFKGTISIARDGANVQL